MNFASNYELASDLIDRMVGLSVSAILLDLDGTITPCLQANASGKISTGPLGLFLTQLLRGKESEFFGGLDGTYLSAKYTTGTTLTVLDESDFSDGDIIIVANLDDLSDAVAAQVNGTPSANSIPIHAALGATFYKNAFVINVTTGLLPNASGRGLNYAPGVITQYERPSSPEVSVADGTGDTVDVTITDVEEDAVTHYDIYVYKQSARPDRIEPNQQPDAVDKTVAQIASAINVSTYGGGADYVPSGTGGSLSSADAIWVAVVAKDGTGQIGVKESLPTWVQHTLD